MKAKTEVVVENLIIGVIVALVALLLADLFFDLQPYNQYLLYFDFFIVIVFITDLVFKYRKITKKEFIKKYWPDIIAAVPTVYFLRFFKIIRVLEYSQRFLRISRLMDRLKKIYVLRHIYKR